MLLVPGPRPGPFWRQKVLLLFGVWHDHGLAHSYRLDHNSLLFWLRIFSLKARHFGHSMAPVIHLRNKRFIELLNIIFGAQSIYILINLFPLVIKLGNSIGIILFFTLNFGKYLIRVVLRPQDLARLKLVAAAVGMIIQVHKGLNLVNRRHSFQWVILVIGW
jgi:hypothetical protein